MLYTDVSVPKCPTLNWSATTTVVPAAWFTTPPLFAA
jgi:hypothetical protein